MRNWYQIMKNDHKSVGIKVYYTFNNNDCIGDFKQLGNCNKFINSLM